MKKKQIALLTSLSLAATLTMAGCGKEAQETAKPKQVLHLVETAEIPTMDSTLATDAVSFKVLTNTMEGLYRLDKNNKATSGMAESVDISKDKKTYTFHLKDAKWSNGDKVTAKDFEYAWKRAVNPETGAQYAYIMFDVKNAEKINKKELPVAQLGVKAIDDKTLEVQLEKPVPYFLELVAFPTFFPLNEKYVTSHGSKFGLEDETTLYNGPFILSNWEHEKGWELKKNNSYWDNKTVKLQEIDVNVVKEVSTTVNLFESGQIDAGTISAEFVDKYNSSPDLRKIKEPTVYFLRFNESSNKLLANVNFRKAIDAAVDKKSVVDVILNNGSSPANYFIPNKFVSSPKGEDFRKVNGDLGKYDESLAKEYWNKAKKETGINTISLELLNFDNDSAKRIGEYYKEQIEKTLPGVTIKIKQQPFAQKLKLETNKDYQISLSGWGPDYPDAMTFLDMFTTENAQNKMAYSNKKYDELVQKAKNTINPQERFDAELAAEKVLLDDMAISPVYQRGRAMLQRENIKDLYYHPTGGEFSYKWTYISNKK
ncbi:peptide ABC transporter substrate-binding protein [Bacillus cereus]